MNEGGTDRKNTGSSENPLEDLKSKWKTLCHGIEGTYTFELGHHAYSIMILQIITNSTKIGLDFDTPFFEKICRTNP